MPDGFGLRSLVERRRDEGVDDPQHQGDDDADARDQGRGQQERVAAYRATLRAAIRCRHHRPSRGWDDPRVVFAYEQTWARLSPSELAV